MTSNVSSTTFLVHTNHHTRPFLVAVPSIARDFAEWGFLVEHKASNSAYIKELRQREAQAHLNNLTHKNRHETRRTKLLEIWGQEIISRRLQERGRDSETEVPVAAVTWGFGDQDLRLKKVGTVVQDFFAELVPFEDCGCSIPKSLLMSDIRDPYKRSSDLVSPTPFKIIRNYMRLLFMMRYSPNTPLPPWADPDIHYADLITIEFKRHEAVKLEHLKHAMERALGKGEAKKMGRTLKVTGTGINRVLLYVDIGDSMVMRGIEEETWDPLPLYERGEHPPDYVEGVAMYE